MEQNLYYAIAQRTQNGKYMNLWINGSDRSEMLLPETLFSVLRERNQEDLIPDIIETVMNTFSLYLVDFTSGHIGLLSALKTKAGKSVMDVLNQTKDMVDNRERQDTINNLLEIGSGPEKKKTQQEKATELSFWGQRKKSNEADTSFQSFLKNLNNYVK